MLPALALRLRVRVLLALLAAAAVCLLATPAVRKFACKIGAMDMPGESRRVHDHPIPRLGGLALFAGFLAGVLPFTGIDEPVQGILLGSVIIVVTGAVDDLVSLRPWVKLVLQIIAAIVAIEPGGTPQVGSEQYNRLLEAKIPIAIYFGDYIDNGDPAIQATMMWQAMRQACYDFRDAYNEQGGNCTVVDLPQEGITGNDHFMFQDLNNDVIANHIENWIQANVMSAE